MKWAETPRSTRHEVSTNGDVRNRETGKILTGGINNRGYRTVHTSHYSKPEFVHRLVAEAFIPNDDPLHKTDVNHKNGNKMDNRVGNLEWCTRSDNVKHAYVNGLNRPSGGGTNKRPVRVIETGDVYESQEECVRAIGGSIGGLSMVINGKRKSNVYKGYHIELV